MHSYKTNIHRNSAAADLPDKQTDDLPPPVIAVLLPLAGVLVFGHPALAADATWLANPADGDFNNAANWDTAAVPNGTATFDASSTTNLSFSGNRTFGGITINSEAYEFTNGQALDINGAGIIVNGGSATITNNGWISFRNASTAGSATIVTSNFGLNFFDLSSAGSATITVTNGAAVSFIGASTAGNATINGDAHFTDLSTAGGATITGGFGFWDASTAGDATITNPSTELFSRFFHVSSAGNATIHNEGNIEFYASSTAENATIINDDFRISFKEASTAGNATIINNSIQTIHGHAFGFYDSSTAGSSTITNNGNAEFRHLSTAGGAAIANNSSLSFRDTATAGDSEIANSIGGVLRFQESSTAGSAAIANSGSLTFYNTSTAETAVIANSAYLAFTDTSTAGEATVTTENGGTTYFMSTATGGDARFVTQSGGTFNISGLSSSGTTAGSIEGAGSHVLGAKNLQVGSNDRSTEVSGVISGTGGSLTKVGDGTLTLSGTNTYTGATTVDDGTLAVNGSIASSSLVTVNTGATLGDTGTVGDASISGALAPGNSIGTITINGNLTLNSSSTYDVEVSPTSADRANVTGTATLDGTAHATFQPGWYLEKNYTILSAAGGLGGTTFDSLNTTSLPSGFAASLDYAGNDVLLTLTATGTVPPNGGGIGQNQQGAVTAITDHFNDGGSLPPGFVTVLGLSGGELETALSQISGEAAAAAQGGVTQASSQFLGTMFAPRAGSAVNSSFAFSLAPTTQEAVPIAYAMGEGGYTGSRPRWSTWVSSFGGSSAVDGDGAAGSHDVSASAYGFAMGVDYQASRKTTLGLAFSGGSTSWSLSDNLGGGTSQDYQLGLNGTTRWEKMYAMAALAYGFHQMSSERTVPGGEVTADFGAHSLSGRIESGARFKTRTGSFITPYAALQAQAYLVPDYGEDDPGAGRPPRRSVSPCAPQPYPSIYSLRLKRLIMKVNSLWTYLVTISN